MGISNTSYLVERLERAGYRLTEPRRAVLAALAGRQTPFTSGELWLTVHARTPTVGRATVFRTLDLLTRLGLVQRIHEDADDGRCHTFLACAAGHHHHLICENCGMVADFSEDRALDALVREVERRTAFRVEGHRLELLGRCPACQTKQDRSYAVALFS